jgi:choline dehydrogenase-like flavoprotein
VSERFDAIVVGSGAAGGFAARELGEQGLSVLLLEAGRAVTLADHEDTPGRYGPNLLGRMRAALFGQPIQARVAFFSKKMVRFLVRDVLHGYRTAKGLPYLWLRGRQMGGRLHIFGRVVHRWSDYEFKPAPERGQPVWPIYYADIEPWYAKAERILGVYGNEDRVETLPDGIMQGDGLLTRAETAFKVGVEQCFKGRRVISWRMAAPDKGLLPRATADALAFPNVEVRDGAVVCEVLTDAATGLATGVRYRDRQTGAEHVVHARSVVLGASPIETVRLMLNSRSGMHERGLGNSSGLLGHYFMDQPATVMLATFAGKPDGVPDEVPIHPVYGTAGGIYVPRYPKGADGYRSTGLGYCIQGSIGRNPHVYPGPTPDGSFMCYSEMNPYFDNAISLDTRRQDRWGVPIPVIRCELKAAERTAIASQAEEIAAMVERAGGSVCGWISPLGVEHRGAGLYRGLGAIQRRIVLTFAPKSFTLGAAIHESGGARMGDDPQASIVDAFNRVWDAPNVVVADASVFPSSGVMGTTLTVMALAMRACARLADDLRTGDFSASFRRQPESRAPAASALSER